ncbi:hypothetical protein D8B26_003136 [Coccidioides posadasii str. Silveira]|uniref:uncharacterized protein n=1 Tax=Coccidioides posadasii (strain RMSCC 757 / Silveira) TaxID=443226 RepID=UPI001BEEBAB0|nr:hypothetical protein D8B26_003136 [Coccidioides posadasii str. Silveira]
MEYGDQNHRMINIVRSTDYSVIRAEHHAVNSSQQIFSLEQIILSCPCPPIYRDLLAQNTQCAVIPLAGSMLNAVDTATPTYISIFKDESLAGLRSKECLSSWFSSNPHP